MALTKLDRNFLDSANEQGVDNAVQGLLNSIKEAISGCYSCVCTVPDARKPAFRHEDNLHLWNYYDDTSRMNHPLRALAIQKLKNCLDPEIFEVKIFNTCLYVSWKPFQ